MTSSVLDAGVERKNIPRHQRLKKRFNAVCFWGDLGMEDAVGLMMVGKKYDERELGNFLAE